MGVDGGEGDQRHSTHSQELTSLPILTHPHSVRLRLSCLVLLPFHACVPS
jgi:hypothetical protein